MEDLFVLIDDTNSGEQPPPLVRDQELQVPPPHVNVDINRRRNPTVPPQLLKNKEHLYHAEVLSLGPYYNNVPYLSELVQLKDDLLHDYSDRTISLFRTKILERLDEIWNFYCASPSKEYTNDVLAEEILSDTCFLLCYIQIYADDKYRSIKYNSLFYNRLGLSEMVFVKREIFMLENQIPFWLIKLLMSLTFDDKDTEEALLCNFLSIMSFGDYSMTRLPWKDQDGEPFNLLEAQRETLIRGESGTNIEPINHQPSRNSKFRWARSKGSTNTNANGPFRSAAELKAKGIHFGPSSNSLKDIRFNSYYFYGKLQLPILLVNNYSKVLLANMIAYEMSPKTNTDYVVTSYVNLMQKLIQSPKDVKELREKGILPSALPDDEEVLKLFKEIDTYGANTSENIRDVKKRIKEHCASKSKTWVAELIDTYFLSPWKVMALLAATYLLFLASVQTYYTVYPK